MVSIFIRTYEKDLQWLNYCLKSIHQNLKGWDEIVICIPAGQEDLLKEMVMTERVVVCPKYADDYIGQQISKLQAHRYVNGEYILFVDSDLIFHPGANVNAYFKSGKPVILKESYTRLDRRHPELNIRRWQLVVKRVFNIVPSHEYMRRAPQLFLKSTLASLEKTFPNMETHAKKQPRRLFSEFNILGFFANQFEPNNYAFVDLEFEDAPPNSSTQNWSWGGITSKIFTQFVELGVADPNHPPQFTVEVEAKKVSWWKRFRYTIKRLFRVL